MIRYWSVWTFCLLSHLFFALQWQRWKAWNCSGDAWVFHNRVFAASASQWPQRLHKLDVNQILLFYRKLFENFGLGSAAKGRVEIEWCFWTNISLSFEIVLQGSTLTNPHWSWDFGISLQLKGGFVYLMRMGQPGKRLIRKAACKSDQGLSWFLLRHF